MSVLTFDQRHYFSHCATISARSRAEQLQAAARLACAAALTTPALAAAADITLAAQEWRGIVRACEREEARITRQRDARMRRTVAGEAIRCEYWLTRAAEMEAAGRHEDAECLRLVARQRSDAAFHAVRRAGSMT